MSEMKSTFNILSLRRLSYSLRRHTTLPVFNNGQNFFVLRSRQILFIILFLLLSTVFVLLVTISVYNVARKDRAHTILATATIATTNRTNRTNRTVITYDANHRPLPRRVKYIARKNSTATNGTMLSKSYVHRQSFLMHRAKDAPGLSPLKAQDLIEVIEHLKQLARSIHRKSRMRMLEKQGNELSPKIYRDDNKISFSRPSRPLEKDTDTGVILQHSAIEKAPVSAKELPLTTWQIVKIASMNIFRRDDGVV